MKKKFKPTAVPKKENSRTFTIDECLKLFEKNNYKQAFSRLSEIAGPENPYSCYLMFKLYFNGLGTPKDLLKAKQWLMMAAERGEPNAEYSYAIYYAPYQKQSNFDYQESFNWLKKAADHGHTRAALELAKLYFSGRGCKQDQNKALELIKSVSQQDPQYNFNEEAGQCYYTALRLKEAYPYLKAAFNEGRYGISGILATYYMRGIEGIPQDVELAFRILKKGADNREGLSEYILGSHYKSEKNIRLAIRYYRSAYEHNLLEAAYELANITMKDPLRSSSDEKQSVRLLIKAAQLPVANHLDAIADLGSCYYSGWGIERDGRKAVLHFNMVLESVPEHPVALFGLANCHLNGVGVERDVNKGLELMIRAAELNTMPAQLELANIYREGDITAKDDQKYLHWLERAAQNNSDRANFILGEIYEEGTVTAKDPQKALQYYTAAAGLAHIGALKKLCRIYQNGTMTGADELKCLYYNELLVNLFGDRHQETDSFSEKIISEYVNGDSPQSEQFINDLLNDVYEIIMRRYDADLPMYCEECPILRSHLSMREEDDLEQLLPVDTLE